MTPPTQLDPVSVAVALVTVALGPQLAAVVGPYAVITVAAITGAAWSLGRRQPGTRLSAFWYFVRLVVMALLLSVGIENLLGQWIVFSSHWLLAPIALVVGGVGDDWPELGRWVVSRAARFAERRSGTEDR